MNNDQVAGKAKGFSAKIKQQWGKLTDDEITEAEGNVDQLTAKIQEKYGDAKESIAEKINKLKG